MDKAQAMQQLLELANELMSQQHRTGPAIGNDLLTVRYALMTDSERAVDLDEAERELRDDDATEADPGYN